MLPCWTWGPHDTRQPVELPDRNHSETAADGPDTLLLSESIETVEKFLYIGKEKA